MFSVATLEAIICLMGYIVLIGRLISFDVGNLAGLGIREDEVAILQEKLDFSDVVSAVITRAGHNITLATLLVSCPGTTAMVLAHEAYSIKDRNYFRVLPMEDGACAASSFSEDARVLWEGVSGANVAIDWLIDAGLRTIVRSLEAAKKLSLTGQDPLGPETAAEMVAGFLASASRLHLRRSFARHRVFGVVSAIHGYMGAHFSFWGDQISPAKSSRDGKCPQQQQQCHVVFKGSDEEECRWWQPLCRLRLSSLAGAEARNAAREMARTGRAKARAVKEAKREKIRREKDRERQARKDKTLESIKNDPHSWIPRWG